MRHAALPRRTLWLIAVLAVCLSRPAPAADSEDEPDGYETITYNALKADLAGYHNDKVAYTATYLRSLTAFPKYIDDSGFDPDDEYLLLIGSSDVPVIARKTKDMIETIAAIKSGQTVKVYGKIDKFRRKPDRTMLPAYFLKLSEIRIVNDPPVGEANERENMRAEREQRRAEREAKRKLRR